MPTQPYGGTESYLIYTRKKQRNLLDNAFKRKDGTFPPSLADKIAGRTLKFALDWALIKVVTGRTMSDRVPLGGAGIKVPLGAEVTRFTKIKHTRSLQVAKKGRTTGWTYGRINGIGSLLNLPHDSTSIVPVDMEQRFGTTDGIMLAFGVMHDRKGEEFMRAGDSGSCVLERTQWESDRCRSTLCLQRALARCLHDTIRSGCTRHRASDRPESVEA
ncbi:hypothetical protein J4E80_005902 [Alternaria sp. BMP 0032]|nr:hypothetical protein J4E80_005902 [Alternaria sp. BMP 0032]